MFKDDPKDGVCKKELINHNYNHSCGQWEDLDNKNSSLGLFVHE